MMMVNEYQKNARKTAIYNDKCVYPTLGLIGECHELVEALLLGVEENIKKEAGDVLWYLANLSSDLGWNMSVVTQTKTFCDKPTRPIDVPYTLFSACGELAENMKKAIRDIDVGFSEDRKEKIKYTLQLIYDYVLLVCRENELDIEEMAKKNTEKLFSRMERGKLGGDGNDR